MPPDFLDHPGPLAFAHRGGAAHAPENSWRAFEHAVSLGYTYLETDVQATADGALIAFHDRTLARVTGLPGRVCRMTLREVTRALIGGTEPIPLLEDLLTAWPGVRFNIDVKDAPAIVPLAGVLRRTNAWDRVCVVSFSASRLRAARRALDRPVCMAASPYAAAAVRFGGPRRHGDGPVRHPVGSRGLRASPAHRGGALHVVNGSGQAARLLPGGAARPSGFLTEWLARTGVRCVQVPAPAASHSLLHRAHALGLHVHAWTVNDRRTMQALLDLGVDGIMTDRTVELREVLAARGQWHPAGGS
jgi:glycerophosphoryl diester phosphodiesterase